jgi:hypothetical protein
MAVRFGLQIPSFSFCMRPNENVFLVARDIAQQAESLAFDSLWLMGPMFQIPVVAPGYAQFRFASYFYRVSP